MKLPPGILAMRIVEEGRTKIKLWLPLFLVWPLLLLLLVLTLVVSLVVDLARLLAGRGHAYTRLVFGGLNVVAESRGTQFFVENQRQIVAMTLR